METRFIYRAEAKFTKSSEARVGFVKSSEFLNLQLSESESSFSNQFKWVVFFEKVCEDVAVGVEVR